MKKKLLAGLAVGMLVIGLTGMANAYSVAGVGWDGPGLGHADLTWSIASITADMSYADQYHITELALAQWATYADISFTYASSVGTNNQIDFYLGADSVATNKFWGFGYYPNDINPEPLAGDVFIDDSANAPYWTTGTQGFAEYTYDINTQTWTSADLYYELLHEIGHSLGMGHPIDASHNLPAGAVMSPFYGGDDNGVIGFMAFDTLQADDIAGIQHLYGTPAAGVPEPSTLLLLGAGLAGIVGLRRII